MGAVAVQIALPSRFHETVAEDSSRSGTNLGQDRSNAHGHVLANCLGLLDIYVEAPVLSARVEKVLQCDKSRGLSGLPGPAKDEAPQIADQPEDLVEIDPVERIDAIVPRGDYRPFKVELSQADSSIATDDRARTAVSVGGSVTSSGCGKAGHLRRAIARGGLRRHRKLLRRWNQRPCISRYVLRCPVSDTVSAVRQVPEFGKPSEARRAGYRIDQLFRALNAAALYCCRKLLGRKPILEGARRRIAQRALGSCLIFWQGLTQLQAPAVRSNVSTVEPSGLPIPAWRRGRDSNPR